MYRTAYRTVDVNGLSVFYREAGPQDAPALLLLHGFPSSSRRWQPLLDRLADQFRLVAPDYPGFGHSDAPSPADFAYTFDHLAAVLGHFTDALGLAKYTLVMQAYGDPLGSRLAIAHPEPERRELRPGPVDRRVRLPQQARSARHPDRSVLRLSHQRRELSRLAGLAPPTPAAPSGRVGPLRPLLPGRGGAGLRQGRARRRGARSRRGPLRPRRAARLDRGPDQEIPAAPAGSRRWLICTVPPPPRW
jgi:pimeloyl-ACP methyl ester carboxylesterase